MTKQEKQKPITDDPEIALLNDCREVIKYALSNPNAENSIIPVYTKHKKTLAEKFFYVEEPPKKLKIFISQINPNGIEFEGYNLDAKNYQVVGMIGKNSIFLYNNKTDDLVIKTIKQKQVNQFGEKFTIRDVVKDGLSDEFTEIQISTVTLSSDLKSRGNSKVTTLNNEILEDWENWVPVSQIIRNQRMEYSKLLREPSDEEMEM